ncbi:MAG TPA: hypothetical protein VHZ24_17905 [Pirellulales bacterium]|jgi:predicted transcriptional regulator|nr:hypothetical protein [Pirellulales bacterium]
MTNKEMVIEAVRKLPDEATLEEISSEVALLAAIQRGEEAADSGHVVPHEDVKQRVARWLSR